MNRVSHFRNERVYKHFDRDFRTKYKVFSFRLDDSGGKIIITERNRFNNFVVEFDLGGGEWLCRIASEVLRIGKKGTFIRKFRGSNYQLLAECNKNRAGWFLKVMKIQNGVIRSIVVPAELGDRGWVMFEKCLKSFYMMDNSKLNRQESFQSRGVKDQNRTLRNQREMEENKTAGQKANESNSSVKLPNLAVVILKQRSVFSWGLIKAQMNKKLGRITEIVPFADDRAVMWCANEVELRSVLEKGDLYRGKVFIATIKKWNRFLLWKFTQI